MLLRAIGGVALRRGLVQTALRVAPPPRITFGAQRWQSSQPSQPPATAADALGEKLDIIWQLRDLQTELPDQLRQAFSRQNMSQPELNQLAIHEAIEKWRRFPGDTGSSEVQIAIFTEKIRIKSNHMGANHKDMHTKRKLQMLVHTRNRMLAYLRRTNRAKYAEVLDALAIRCVPRSRARPAGARALSVPQVFAVARCRRQRSHAPVLAADRRKPSTPR